MKKLSLVILAAVGISASAQVSHPVQKVNPVNLILSEVADSLKVYEAFAENSPADYRVPNAPRFAVVGKNRKFYLGIGGDVKATMSFDWGSPIRNYNEFIVSAIPMGNPEGNKGQFGLSGQQSDFFLNFVALPDNPNKIGVYVNAILLGNGYLPQIRSAYVKYRGIEAGYGFSLFTDLAADPPTIDYEGPNSFTVVINAKFDYRHNFGKYFGIGVGAELPMASYTNATHTSDVTQRIPDIPAYVQWNFGNNNRIRLSGLLRNMQYRDLATHATKNLAGWGVQLSGNFNICDKLIGYYQATTGKGMTSYFEDLTGLGLDMTPVPDNNGALQTVKAWGGYLGLQYNICDKCYCSATYSHLRNYAQKYSDSNTPWATQYKYGQYVVGNFFYNINNLFTWGIEYIWGRRVDMNRHQAHDNRVQTMLQINF